MKSKLYSQALSFIICLFLPYQVFPISQQGEVVSAGYPDFFPNTPGTWWTYEVIRYPNPYCCPDSTINSEVTIRIVSNDTMSFGLPVAKWEVSISDSLLFREIFPFGEDSVVYVGQAGDVVMLYRSVQDIFSNDTLLRFPLIVGQAWGVWGWSFINSLDSIESVAVPAGVFENSIHVSRTGGWWQAPIDRLEWLKESVGFIKIIHTQSGLFNNKIVMLLKDYHIVSTPVKEQDSGIPPEFKLSQNYPNPFNPKTNIELQIVNFGLVKLSVFDLLGREVATLVDEELQPGSYSVSWDAVSVAGGLSGGVYFYRLQAGNFVDVKKLLYIK